MEGELFLDGHPPDFSLLQQLLFPPCLEPEPGGPAPASPGGGFGSAPGGGSRPAGRPRPELPLGSAGCLPGPASGALRFLQESARRLCREEPSRAPRAQQPSPGPAVRPGRSVPQHPPGASALSCPGPGPMDALTLISLHCSHLAPPGSPPGSPGAPQPGWGRRHPRKQPAPSRGAEPRDPAFRGVTFRMRLCPCQGGSDGHRLLISPRYSSAVYWKTSRKPNPSQISLTRELCRASSSEEDQDSRCVQSNKCCASCQTRKTPLWRIAEDGTPLCNACGIRYKKYRVRCFRCWTIPKKSGKSYSRCCNCGDKLHTALAQQKAVKRKYDNFLKPPSRTFCC